MSYTKEEIIEIIKEELSIADAVNCYVDSVVSNIKEMNRNGHFNLSDEYVITINNETATYRIKTFLTNSVLYGNVTVNCMVNVLEFENEASTVEYADKTQLWNENFFDQTSSTIRLTIDGFDGKINLRLLKYLLYHETEHAYQFLRKMNTLISPESCYHKAKAIVNGKDIHHTRNEYTLIANLLYYFHSREIDANVNGLYGEMDIVGLTDIEQTNFGVENDKMNKMFNYFLGTLDKTDYSDTLSYFGLTINRFVKYIRHQQEYLRKKVNNIYAKLSKKNVVIERKIRKHEQFNLYK